MYRGRETELFRPHRACGGIGPTWDGDRAQREGDEWVINGEKHFITWAGDADFVILFARTGPRGDIQDHGITAFLVPVETDGLTIPRSIPVIRPEYPFEIQLDGVRVPDENVLGEVGGGLDIAKECLGETRILYASHSLGPMAEAIDMGIEWANERTVGDERLADKQAIQWKLAESAIDLQQVKHSVYQAAWKYDQGRDVRHASSMAKYVATERLYDVLDRIIQIHGGMGVSSDLPLERWLREARVRRIGEGPSEIHLKTIARNLLEGYADPDPMSLD